ncbi:hypothetical protein RUM43_005153 [Polyplax serrata]|uniref:Uncharacterized protein n=1 Tax=Polyplax serrata TaxID=468196 RepID=A0AAN8XMA0_POLSC
MKQIGLLICLLLVRVSIGVSQDGRHEEDELIEDEKAILQKKIAKQLSQILEHYKQEDPVGLPNAPVPDPMTIPDMKHSFSVATMNFQNVSVHGLSIFRIDTVESNIAEMEVSIAMSIEQLFIKGQYTMSSWFSRQKGDFNVTLQGVVVKGLASLEVNPNGQLEAQNINMDITFQHIAMNFQNLGFMGSLFQGIINSVGTFLFDSIKPFILSQVNTNVRGDVNKQIMQIPQRFPNSIPPLDMFISEMRKYVRSKKYDPYKVNNYNSTAGIFSVELTNIWVTGLATFHRVGNITLTMKKNVLYMGTHVGTKQLFGSCQWEVGVAGLMSRAGSVTFATDYVQVNMTVSQPLDVRKRPSLEDLNLKIGNMQMRVNGAGTADYIMEFVVNVLPNILRYQVVDAIEGPLKVQIQNYLDLIEVEQMIDENLPRMYDLMSLNNINSNSNDIDF